MVVAKLRPFYRIQNSEPDFSAGVTGDGRQVLMGVKTEMELLALFFDMAGELVNAETRLLPLEPLTSGINPHESSFVDKVSKALRIWQDELQFQPGVISVRAFKNSGIWIDELPSHLGDFLRDRSSIEPNENKWSSRVSEIQDWMDSGMFVLWWGKDYWMDSDGNIDTT